MSPDAHRYVHFSRSKVTSATALSLHTRLILLIFAFPNKHDHGLAALLYPKSSWPHRWPQAWRSSPGRDRPRKSSEKD